MACRCCPGGIGRSRRVPRYPSDMSDAEWQVIEPTLPAPAWKAGKGGRPAGRCRRDYVDAIRYLVKEGIQRRAMPADLPHWRTVYDVADGWHKSGATGKMHDELRRQCRIAAGRKVRQGRGLQHGPGAVGQRCHAATLAASAAGQHRRLSRKCAGSSTSLCGRPHGRHAAPVPR